MREEWHSVTHLLKVAINHNRSTHGQNLESINDIVHSWMIFFWTSCNNPFVLGWGIGHDMGSLQARQVTNQKQASRVKREVTSRTRAKRETGFKPEESWVRGYEPEESWWSWENWEKKVPNRKRVERGIRIVACGDVVQECDSGCFFWGTSQQCQLRIVWAQHYMHRKSSSNILLLQPSSLLYVVVGWQATKNHHASVRRICGREEWRRFERSVGRREMDLILPSARYCNLGLLLSRPHIHSCPIHHLSLFAACKEKEAEFVCIKVPFGWVCIAKP